MKCPYCNGIATLRSSKEIYKVKDFGLMFICENYPKCDTYVGVHKGTNVPLGNLSNKELRYWKKIAHSIFDLRWKSPRKKEKRSDSYRWLSEQLSIPFKYCHIAMFNVEQCKKTIDVCKKDMEKKNELISTFC